MLMHLFMQFSSRTHVQIFNIHLHGPKKQTKTKKKIQSKLKTRHFKHVDKTPFLSYQSVAHEQVSLKASCCTLSTEILANFSCW